MTWAINLIVALKFEGRMRTSQHWPFHIRTILGFCVAKPPQKGCSAPAIFVEDAQRRIISGVAHR